MKEKKSLIRKNRCDSRGKASKTPTFATKAEDLAMYGGKAFHPTNQTKAHEISAKSSM